jgi:hypothetical protein
MSRFEKVDGYNAIKDNENLVYTLAEYEPKCYGVDEFDVDELLHLLNTMNDEINDLKGQIAYLANKNEEDE